MRSRRETVAVPLSISVHLHVSPVPDVAAVVKVHQRTLHNMIEPEIDVSCPV
jgi:hypothetical protein